MDPPNKVCECAFHLNKEDVCSSDMLLQRLKQLLKTHYRINSTGKHDIINKAKQVTKCATESCVLSKPEIVKSIGYSIIKHELNENFKPAGPALDKNALLNNFNIDEVLDQFAKTYPEFYHIPFQMIDFAENSTSDIELLNTYNNSINDFALLKHKKDTNLATIDIIEKYNNGYRTFGVVLNTDVSSGPGKHWFCIFIDLRHLSNDESKSDKNYGKILYFNSSGNLPLHPVFSWLSDTKMKLMVIDKKIEIIRVATHRLQADDVSCGIWCLYFIYSMLNGVSYIKFQPGQVSDQLMYEFRKHFFRHHDIDQKSTSS